MIWKKHSRVDSGIMIKETTVIVPTYNHARYLDRCLRSLLSQATYQDFEIICVNDGSTDETPEILQRYESEITVIKNPINLGLPSSINKAIRNSKSQFLVRVDSDDYVSRDFLGILTLALKSNKKIDSVACDYELFDESGSIRIVNCIEEPIACGIAFRRDHLIDIGLYDESFKIHEDKELMQRYLQKYSVDRLPIPLYRYRMHGANMTKNFQAGDEYLKKLNKGIRRDF